MDVEKFTANLKNGVLIVTAPKDLERVAKRIRKIPVVSEDEEEQFHGDTKDRSSASNIARKQDQDTMADTDDDMAPTDSTKEDELNDK